MSYSVGTAWLEIVPSMDGVQRTIENELRGVDTRRAGQSAGDGYTAGFGGAAKKITGILGAAFAAVKVGDFAKDAVAQASDLAESATKLEAVFGDGTEAVNTFASQGAKALGQTNLAIKDAAATFGIYGKAAGLAGSENAKFSTDLVTLSTDLASFYNADPSQTVEALGAALRGESEPMRQFGVLLDDATLRNKALQLGLISTTKDALTPQQKVLAAQASIMEQTTVAQGDFARTSGGLANQQRILAAQFEDMKGKLGQAFLPAVTATVTALNEKLFPVLEAAGTKVSAFYDRFQNSDAYAKIKGGLTEAFSVLTKGDFLGGNGFEEDSPFIKFLFNLRDTVKDTFGQAFDTLGQAWGQIGPPLMEAFKTIWEAVKPLIPTFLQLFQAFNPVGLLFKAIMPLLPNIAGMLGDLAKVLADGIARALQAVAPLFQTLVDVINRLMPFVTQLVASLLPPLMSLFDRLTPLISAILDALIPLIDKIAQSLIPIIEALMPVVERVFTFIADTIGNVINVFSGVIDVITGVLSGDWAKVWDGIKGIFSAVWDQLVNILSTAWDVIVELFTNLGPKVLEIIDGFLSWMVQKGQDFIGWLWQGIQNAAGAVWDWFRSLPGWAWDKIVESTAKVVSWGGEFIGWLIQGIKDGISKLWDWITGSPSDPNTLLGGLWNTFTSIGSKLLEFGGKVVDWIVQGIKDGISKVADAITGLFDDLTFNGDGTISTPQGYVTANPFAGGTARGGVIPGSDPGRFDNVVGRLPNGMGWGLRSGESVFVPEFTDAIGGAGTVHAWNRAAEQGRLGDYLPGFARGGVVGYGETAAENIAKKITDGNDPWITDVVSGLLGKAVKAFSSLMGSLFGGSSVSGGLNLSQDPSSFGWTRASGIVPFAWQGNTVTGGVAGGTEGLWSALLSALVPSIPGGLLSPMYGYENRDNVNSPGTPSFHSYGLAVDINAPYNANGAPGYGRSGQGVIPAELAHSLAAKFGMLWGGDFTGTPDPMHFEIHVSPNQISGGGIISNIASGIWSQVTGSGVERWRPTVLQALGLTGQSPSWADAVLKQMDSESSGRPDVVNTWDRNYPLYGGSKGLMQLIPPTFARYALPGYNTNIFDPLSNIIASIRYVLGTYPEGLARFNRAQAYDWGGWLMPGTQGVNLLNRPEAVLTPAQSDAYVTHAKMVEAGFGGGTVVVELRSGDVLTDAMIAAAQVTVDGVVTEAHRQFATAGGQSWP